MGIAWKHARNARRGLRVEADNYARASLPRTGSRGRTRIFTSTREPRRFKIDINRSAVNLPRSAFRIREKSAAAKPVWAWAARTVSSSRSRVFMISAAKSAFNCSISAFSRPRSQNTFPLQRTNFSLSPFTGILLYVVIFDNESLHVGVCSFAGMFDRAGFKQEQELE
jgi:hypothetical protein